MPRHKAADVVPEEWMAPGDGGAVRATDGRSWMITVDIYADSYARPSPNAGKIGGSAAALARVSSRRDRACDEQRPMPARPDHSLLRMVAQGFVDERVHPESRCVDAGQGRRSERKSTSSALTRSGRSMCTQ